MRLLAVLLVLVCSSITEAQVLRKFRSSPAPAPVCTGPGCPTPSFAPRVVYSSPVPSYPIETVVYSEVVPSVSQVLTSDASILSTTNTAFRRTLLQAARESRKSGAIDTKQYFTIVAASYNPRAMDRIRSAVQDAAIEEGLVAVNAEIDWDAILAFIKELIPLIIQLIELFS